MLRVGVNVGVRGMARELNRLSARTVATVKKPGRHADGGGLYLVVDKSRRQTLGVPVPVRRATQGNGTGWPHQGEPGRSPQTCRVVSSTLAKGENPIEARKVAGRVPTFGECADEYVVSMAGNWRNEQHRAQWGMTLTRYTETIRSMPVQ